MKAGVAIFGTLIVVGAILAAFLVGFAVGGRVAIRDELRKLGFTRQTATLFTRARKILVRLIEINKLDGPQSEDYLSPETKSVVTAWVNDYRKEVNNS